MSGFVPNTNPDIDDSGSKWSITALKKYLISSST